MGKKTFKDLTTFKIGGKIKHFIEVKSKDEVISAVKFAKSKNLKIFIIGGGSDILASDKDFEGVVIKYTRAGFSLTQSSSYVIAKADAGVIWDDWVGYTVDNNLQGIECLSGIPGTVGAAPIQNIGAYGQELSSTFESLTAYDIVNECFLKFDKEKCNFGYRDSFFKKPENWQKYIITDVTLRLVRNGIPEIKYEALLNSQKIKNSKSLTLKDIRNAVLEIRSSKFESPKVNGNAGSFFKNPVVDDKKLGSLLKKYPDMIHFDNKLSAGWLIEKAGWKGKEYKSIGVSPKHALILINLTGKAKADDAVKLSDNIIKDIQRKFGITLEREVQLINF